MITFIKGKPLKQSEFQFIVMKHLSILVPYGHTSIVNIEGTHQVFNYVNQFLEMSGREAMFNVELVGLSASATQSNGLFTVNAQKVIQEIENRSNNYTCDSWRPR